MNRKSFMSRLIKLLVALLTAYPPVLRALAGVLLTILLLTPHPISAGDNQWSTQGPYGGPIRSVAIDPTNTDILYAGTTGGGAFKSTDAGANWTAIGPENWSRFSISVVIDPATPTTLHTGWSTSTDGGANWVNAASGASSPVVIDPTNTNILYGNGGGGIEKSIDGGANYVTVLARSEPGLALALDPTTPTTVYASLGWEPCHQGSTSFLFKTTNGGV